MPWRSIISTKDNRNEPGPSAGAALSKPRVRGELCVLETALPVRRANDLQRQLPVLTGGEGVIEATFAGYGAVRGERPTRAGAPTAPGNSAAPERGPSV